MNNLQPDTTAPSGAGPLTRSGQAVASGSGLRDYHSATPHSFAPTPSGSYPPQSLQQPAQINYTPSGSNFQYQSPEYQHQMLPPLSNQRIFDVPQASSSSSSTYYSHLEQPSPGFPPHPMTQPYYPMPAHQQHLTRQIPVPDPSSELIDERVRNAQLDERHAQGQHLLAQLRSELAFLDSLLAEPLPVPPQYSALPGPVQDALPPTAAAGSSAQRATPGAKTTPDTLAQYRERLMRSVQSFSPLPLTDEQIKKMGTHYSGMRSFSHDCLVDLDGTRFDLTLANKLRSEFLRFGLLRPGNVGDQVKADLDLAIKVLEKRVPAFAFCPRSGQSQSFKARQFLLNGCRMQRPDRSSVRLPSPSTSSSSSSRSPAPPASRETSASPPASPKVAVTPLRNNPRRTRANTNLSVEDLAFKTFGDLDSEGVLIPAIEKDVDAMEPEDESADENGDSA